MESGELKTILAELPQDDKWDLEVAVERGYSKAGLVRYHLEGLKSLTTSSHNRIPTKKRLRIPRAAKSPGKMASCSSRM